MIRETIPIGQTIKTQEIGHGVTSLIEGQNGNTLKSIPYYPRVKQKSQGQIRSLKLGEWMVSTQEAHQLILSMARVMDTSNFNLVG